MKIRGYLIFLTIITLTSCLLTACQPTPEKVIVIQKDQEDMIGKAQSTDDLINMTSSPIVVPNMYTLSTTGADGKLLVSVDAGVTVPDTDKISTRKVVPEAFSKELVHSIITHLYGDTPLYEVNVNGSTLTKKEIEEQIITMEADIASGRFKKEGDSLEAARDRIDHLRSMYDSAPATKDEPVLFDLDNWGNSLDESNINIYSKDTTTGDWSTTYKCTSSSDVSANTANSEMHYINYVTMGGNAVNYTMDGAIKVHSDSDISDDLKEKLGVSFQQASQIGQDFLSSTGITDMEYRSAYIIDDHGTGDVDGYTGDANNYAIKLYYTRSVDNSPVLVLGKIDEDKEDEYGYSWPFERLEILITIKGIAEIDWVSPCLASEVITDKTNIITFDEAIKIFENKIMTIYEAKVADIFKEGIENNLIESIDISVDSIQLGLLRIKQQNTAGEKYGLYVPVWAFYGIVTYNYTDAAWEYGIPIKLYNDGVQCPEGPYIVLAINAIDESLIDISLGY